MNSDNDLQQKPYTASSLAAEAGVDFSHIARLCREGKIPAQKFGNAWFITYEDGLAWLEERKQKQKAKQQEEE